ncbi:conserved unknown protein [Ectocarpus siliculosus]|uniref:Uncharacterized protein n=1 Tax=Ectocarpus siliculosus TaxID=2880 RepID=D7FMH0_ECTSI|nr:conserved unknown protein [Ectocarpus siliculosus]|eukprot:CBJ25867.1 conserved unknown protein [Ectocarpus siliculosus]
MSTYSRNEAAPSSARHSGSNNIGPTSEPIATPNHAPGGGSGSGKGSGEGSASSDEHHIFEVIFPPTGPLGITFEWAVDRAAVVRPALPPTSQTLDDDEDYTSRRQETTSPRLARARATTTETGHDTVPHSGERQPLAATSGSGEELLRDGLGLPRGRRLSQEHDRTKSGLPSTDTSNGAVSGPLLDKSHSMRAVTSLNGTTRETAERQGGAEAFGPAAGREILRPGDILVEVNGMPVAGDAARDAGIVSFEDAVGVVAAATAARSPTPEAHGQLDAAARQRPRVLKFRREGRGQRPSSASVTLLLPSPRDPSKGGWVNGIPGGGSAGSRSSSGTVTEQDTTGLSSRSAHGLESKISNPADSSESMSSSSRSSRSPLHPVLQVKGVGQVPHMAAGDPGDKNTAGSWIGEKGMGEIPLASSRSRASDASSVDMDGLSALSSLRSRSSVRSKGSESSFNSRATSKTGGVPRSRKRGGKERQAGGRSGAFQSTSTAERIKAEARRGEALLEPLVCPRQQLLKNILETSETLQPLAVRLTNLSYWYQQRRLLGGARHMHRGAVFDPRTKRWEASVYMLGDRPSDGKLVPILTPIKSVGTTISTKGQALAIAAKSAKERDANPGAVRGPKPPGMTQLTMLQTHISILVVSDAFTGLSHADRLALVFTTLHNELAASARPPPSLPDNSTNAFSSPLPSSNTPPSSLLSPATKAKKTATALTPDSVEGGRRDPSVADEADDRSNARRGVSVQSPGYHDESKRAAAGRPHSIRVVAAGGERQVGEEKGSSGGGGREEGGRNDVSNGGRLPVGTASPSSVHPIIPIGDINSQEERRKDGDRRQRRRHRVIRGNVKASFVGQNVEGLPVWGALDAIAGSSLLVDCRTPAQWRAETFPPTQQDRCLVHRQGPGALYVHSRSHINEKEERFEELWGPARSGHRTLANNPRVKEGAVRSTMERIIAESKALREAAPKFEHFDRFGESNGDADQTKGNPPPPKKSGGESHGAGHQPNTNPSVATPAATKAGRTHPHFFHGLGPNARKLFMELYTENRSRLLAPISRRSADVAGPVASSGRHLSAAPAPPDGTSLPSPTTARNGSQLSISRQQQQQLHEKTPPREEGKSPRSVSGSFAAVGGGGGGGAAAENVRHAAGAFAASGPPPDLDAGVLDRYGVLLGRLVEAATRIQRERRLGGLPRAARRLWRRQRAVLAVQRVFRGHLGRSYASMWKVVAVLAATRLSAGWRRFSTQRKFLAFRARARAGAIGLQRSIRGFLVRKAYKRRFQEAVRVKVIVPSAGVLQKCWRGKKGREEGALRRRMWAAAIEIQRHVRGFSKRMWWARVLFCRLEHAMATRIAAVGRGYIDRELVKARRSQRHFLHTITPACVLIQSQWRGYTRRRDLAKHKQRWLAALFIQVAYRGAVFRRHARRRYEAWLVRHKGFSATKIQVPTRRERGCHAIVGLEEQVAP